ncbi:bifunctional diguanylate cyclase/phosphodiesterase [Jatrophihabitans sp. GAS493]|uniref:putative bifunctional diguanylate cyclase/phosphodiesterase n=1 Tax=Jatrophihabitans sp. GAS493 TaxID=1907575 RepID=UPI001561A45E|nr:bifunctional diguanylate cyclase/phosphodiesterase [Jatrophihabitans sp. GAS493]
MPLARVLAVNVICRRSLAQVDGDSVDWTSVKYATRATPRTAPRAGSVRRLFAIYAAVSLVPVLLLGVVLMVQLRSEGNSRGLAEGRAKADLIARTGIAPVLDARDLRRGLTSAERDDLARSVRSAVADQSVLRVRLRDLDGKVVFADDQTGEPSDLGADDEAKEAADGRTISELSWLNADDNDGGPLGPRVVEVYQPLLAAQSGNRIGVLEMYVPYAPIESDIAGGQRSIALVLSLGLLLLWFCLLGVSASVIRRLRSQFRATAYLASHDTLTGLPNRTRFTRAIARDSEESSTPLAVALVNLDRFRNVNDALGHTNGDELIRIVAQRLSSRVQPGDTVARLAGDEFGIVLRGIADPLAVAAALEELRTATFGQHIEIDGLPLSIEASIGFTVDTADNVGQFAPAGRPEPESLLREADIALSVAKREHRRVVRYTRTQDTFDSVALTLLAELPAAITTGQLELHYQPKYDLRARTVDAVEALVRWRHPTLGLLTPQAFLLAVEQTDLIDDLTRWLLRTVGAALPDLDPAGHLSVAVNISARNLLRADFADEVLQILHTAGADPRRIILEITETAVLADPPRAVSTLGRLAEAGLRISIDDFGVGQTSLAYLSSMPIAELKIDQAFVFSMSTNAGNASIVSSVIELGHSLGLSVTAEGVETLEHLQRLQRLGCDTIQGFYISRPVPAGEIVAQLAAINTTVYALAESASR